MDAKQSHFAIKKPNSQFATSSSSSPTAQEAAPDGGDEAASSELSSSSAFSQWFLRVLDLAQVLDNKYPIKGMYMWKPSGYFMYKQLCKLLKQKVFKPMNYKENAFPLIVPESILKRNESHGLG